MRRAVLHLLKSEDGPTAVEYAVMLAMIAGVCIASVLAMSNAAGNSFDNSAAEIASALAS